MTNAERVANCRATRSRLEIIFTPEERARLEAAANGQPLAAYIKAAITEKMERERSQKNEAIVV